jgi:hypothetical protein
MKLRRAQRLVVGISTLAIGTMGMILFLACAPWISVPEGVLVTEGVTVSSPDGSWKVHGNSRFRPPFYSNFCTSKPTTTNYIEGERLGGRRVRISYPGLSEPLYGLLSLCKVSPDYKGAASRSYQIDVPKQYVDATDSGRISVVYEEYPLNAEGEKMPAWILWLSRTPFPGQ